MSSKTSLLDGEIAAAKPLDLFPSDEPASHRVVLSLHPVRRRVGQTRSAGGADVFGRQDVDRGPDPAAIDFMIRVDECEDATPSLARRAVAQLRDGACCASQDRCPSLDAGLADPSLDSLSTTSISTRSRG